MEKNILIDRKGIETDESLKDIKENCVGYFYSWAGDEKLDLGSEEDKKLIPFGVPDSIIPISWLEEKYNNIPMFEARKTPVSERAGKRLEKLKQENKNKIIIYNVPLDMKQLDFMRNRFGSESHIKELNKFSLGKEYVEAVKKRFTDPFLIHSISPYILELGKGRNDFYIVGEKQLTSKLIDIMINQEKPVKDILHNLFGLDKNLAEAGYGFQDTLMVYDKSRKPKLQSKSIK